VSAAREHPEFDAAVLALIASVESDEPLSERHLAVLLQGLGRYLRATFRGLDREDEVDAVNDGLLRFIEALRSGRVNPQAKPAGYLTRTVANAAVDRLRQRRREAPDVDIEELADDDTSLDDVLELLVGQDAVLRLMARVRDCGEHELNDLIRTFKDLAEVGRTPTQRQLGAALNLSHTEIRRRLDRLAALMRDLEETPS
jgi:DNA-directed RNA polymerase specialized sigma24 family protein